jgi:hypothetical protein
MSYLFLFFVLALHAGIFYLVVKKKWIARVQALEKDLQCCLTAVSQMAEIHLETHRKFSESFEGIEERMIELSIPSPESNLPLERRHQVLALARQGLALEDIVKRLKAPVGEAELILNLGKYMGAQGTGAIESSEKVRQYA